MRPPLRLSQVQSPSAYPASPKLNLPTPSHLSSNLNPQPRNPLTPKPPNSVPLSHEPHSDWEPPSSDKPGLFPQPPRFAAG